MFEGTGWEAQERIFRQASGVFLDTSSLISMEEYGVADKVWGNLRIFHQQTGHVVNVALEVIRELDKHRKKKAAGTAKERELAAKAQKAAERLVAIKQEGWLVVRKVTDGDSTFADKVMLSQFLRLMDRERFLLITQDNGLAQSALNLNEMHALDYRKDLNVRRVTPSGNLAVFPFDPHLEKSQPPDVGGTRGRMPPGAQSHPKSGAFRARQAAEPKKKSVPPAGQVFRHAKMASLDPRLDQPLWQGLGSPPHLGGGSRVYEQDGEAFTLEALGKQGGEGTLYRLRPGKLVAKIYHPQKLTGRHYEKLRRMTANQIRCPGICWPRKLLFRAPGARPEDFVGFAMEEANPQARSLDETIFQRPVMESSAFSQWKKKDVVHLALTILRKIDFLHERNVLLGDINGGNFLFVSPDEVYLVDTDSYQIEDLPCPVGKNEYVPPELVPQIKGGAASYKQFLRTGSNENYAIAVLLFRIVMMGQFPYSKQGSSKSFLEDAQEMDFPYPAGDHHSHNEPPGGWKYLWSHLTRKVKDAFFETFQRGEAHNAPFLRYGVKGWIEIFKAYEYALTHYMGENDPASLELFPQDFKDAAQGKKIYESQQKKKTAAQAGSGAQKQRPQQRKDYHKQNSFPAKQGMMSAYQNPSAGKRQEEQKSQENTSRTIFYIIGTIIWLYIFYRIVA